MHIDWGFLFKARKSKSCLIQSGCKGAFKKQLNYQTSENMNPFITIRKPLLATILLLGSFLAVAAEPATENSENLSLEAAAALLTQAEDFSDQEKNLERLANYADERVFTIFQYFAANELYYVKETNELVAVESQGDKYKITTILSGKLLDITDRDSLNKVKSKNSLRSKANDYLAILQLKSPNDATRQAAVKNIVTSMDAEKIGLLDGVLKTEKNSDIIELIQIGKALIELNADDVTKQTKSIAVLSGSVIPVVKNQLLKLVDNETADPEVKKQARIALARINDKIARYEVMKTIAEGLSAGSILLLIAVGLAITFGVMRVINMAHGELMMLGAYTTYVIEQLMPAHITMSIIIAIPAAFLVSGFFGILIERYIIRYLHGRPLDTLLATFGVGLILQQLVRSIFGPTNMPIVSPEFMKGAFEINDVFAITYNRISIFFFAITVFVALILILKKTNLGLQVRAVAANRSIAKAMGVRSERIDAMTFGLGSGIAGLAGVALSQVTNVGPNMGQQYIIDSFMVVVFGGVGNLFGTFASGSFLGMLTKLLESWYGAVIASILVLIFIILFIQKWPRGLFPQKGRAAESE